MKTIGVTITWLLLSACSSALHTGLNQQALEAETERAIQAQLAKPSSEVPDRAYRIR